MVPQGTVFIVLRTKQALGTLQRKKILKTMEKMIMQASETALQQTSNIIFDTSPQTYQRQSVLSMKRWKQFFMLVSQKQNGLDYCLQIMGYDKKSGRMVNIQHLNTSKRGKKEKKSA